MHEHPAGAIEIPDRPPELSHQPGLAGEHRRALGAGGEPAIREDFKAYVRQSAEAKLKLPADAKKK